MYYPHQLFMWQLTCWINGKSKELYISLVISVHTASPNFNETFNIIMVTYRYLSWGTSGKNKPYLLQYVAARWRYICGSKSRILEYFYCSQICAENNSATHQKKICVVPRVLKVHVIGCYSKYIAFSSWAYFQIAIFGTCSYKSLYGMHLGKERFTKVGSIGTTELLQLENNRILWIQCYVINGQVSRRGVFSWKLR